MRENRPTPRRALRLTLATALLSACAMARADADALREMLDASLKDHKGVTLYLNGQAVQGRVSGFFGDQIVELTGREYARIRVRLDRIDGIAGN